MKEIYDFLGRGLYEKLSNLFLEEFNPDEYLKDGKILDLGCGTGRYCEFFGNYGEVLGVDIDESSIEIARKRCSENEKIRFKVSNIKKFESDEMFSMILFMGNSIAHFSFEEMETIIEKYLKNLSPGGIFMIEISSPLEIIKSKEFSWRDFKEELLEFDLDSGLIKRRISKKEKEIVLESYFWLPFMANNVFEKRGLKKIKSFGNKNNQIILYKNEK